MKRTNYLFSVKFANVGIFTFSEAESVTFLKEANCAILFQISSQNVGTVLFCLATVHSLLVIKKTLVVFRILIINKENTEKF